MNRRITWAAFALCLAILATVVEAHMALKKTEPAERATITAPPAAITLWFTQKPDLAVSRLVAGNHHLCAKMKRPDESRQQLEPHIPIRARRDGLEHQRQQMQVPARP